MDTINIILILIGVLITIIGIAAFINPNFSKFIYITRVPRLQAITAPTLGLIILFYSIIDHTLL